MSFSWKTIPPTIVLVGKNPEPVRIATEAMQLAFSGAKSAAAEDLVQAAQCAAHAEDTLLVLFTSGDDEIGAAAATLDAAGLPRWGIVVLGDGPVPPDVVAVPPADWEARTLAHVFRLTLALHRRSRESARFRGDLSTFGTRVAHDLRSPLGGVLTTVDVLKEVLGDEAPSRVPLLDPILESTDGLTKLIRQTSMLARASTGKNSRERFNMSLAFWAAFQRVEREAVSLGATIVQPTAWPEVEGDPAWMEAMWHALLCNSLQHSGPKPHIEAGWTHRVGENRFWLTDRGDIPLAKRAALFQPFHQLHHPNAPRGFGLPIVQRLAELQGGVTGYEPVTEGGSCFFFTLPAMEQI